MQVEIYCTSPHRIKRTILGEQSSLLKSGWFLFVAMHKLDKSKLLLYGLFLML